MPGLVINLIYPDGGLAAGRGAAAGNGNGTSGNVYSNYYDLGYNSPAEMHEHNPFLEVMGIAGYGGGGSLSPSATFNSAFSGELYSALVLGDFFSGTNVDGSARNIVNDRIQAGGSINVEGQELVRNPETGKYGYYAGCGCFTGEGNIVGVNSKDNVLPNYELRTFIDVELLAKWSNLKNSGYGPSGGNEGRNYHSNSSGFEGFNQNNIDFAGDVAGGLTTVFEAASYLSDFFVVARRIGVAGYVATGMVYTHALATGQAKPSHHLDVAITGTLLTLSVFPVTAPIGVTAGFIYGGARLIGGEVFDNWYNSQYTTTTLNPNKP